jgi:hypothetical protein
MGFLNILTLVFVVLKLTNYIDWSWTLVLLPTFINLLLLIAAFTVAVIASKR